VAARAGGQGLAGGPRHRSLPRAGIPLQPGQRDIQQQHFAALIGAAAQFACAGRRTVARRDVAQRGMTQCQQGFADRLPGRLVAGGSRALGAGDSLTPH